MSDLLRQEYINNLPQPLRASFYGGTSWPLYDICVETGCLRVDVVGLLEVRHISDVKYFTDSSGEKHDSESFYCDYIDA